MASAGHPLALLDLRKIPAAGPMAQRMAEIDSIMTGPHPQPVNPTKAFDAVIHVDKVTPWHTFI